MTDRLSDDEFIKLWKELQSTKAVAEATNISIRNTIKRRKRLEERHGIVLPHFDQRPAYNRVAVDHERAVAKLEISDGSVLIGSDFHIWPGQRTTMQRAFIAFAAKHKPVAVILNGDVVDGSTISRYPSIGWESKPTIRQELEAVSDFLGDLVKVSGKAKRIWNLGNHDARFESRIAAVAPEFAGVQGVHLKDHFDQWTPAWRTDINNDVIVKHRGVGGEHADWNNVIKSGMTFVTGHDHRAGVVPYHDYRGMRWGVRCGYMAESPLSPQFVNYMEASSPNWHPAFCLLTFRHGQLLQPEICWRFDDGVVQFRGELIEV